MPSFLTRWAAPSLLVSLALSCSSTDDATTPPGQDTGTATDTAVSSDTATSDDTTVADTAADTTTPPTDAPADADLGPYPSGPYGVKDGDVLVNLDWEGYVNETADAISTTKPYGPTSLDKLRRAGKGYALIHISEFI